ncbi:hypothetical protein BASA61_006993 [Batrachochytrium salamandrivorans]|nr:hypothetical protein BASA60_004831 [Batrachochytrium salamandrivorans]KAH6585200.1 hypothetical protein BASA61_006993 [Batrachochytrium salamandrivorans]KAH9275885.1 hypothetical protein BASA83_001691 [Batrachochytrium salamandrivorans]
MAETQSQADGGKGRSGRSSVSATGSPQVAPSSQAAQPIPSSNIGQPVLPTASDSTGQSHSKVQQPMNPGEQPQSIYAQSQFYQHPGMNLDSWRQSFLSQQQPLQYQQQQQFGRDLLPSAASTLLTGNALVANIAKENQLRNMTLQFSTSLTNLDLEYAKAVSMNISNQDQALFQILSQPTAGLTPLQTPMMHQQGQYPGLSPQPYGMYSQIPQSPMMTPQQHQLITVIENLRPEYMRAMAALQAPVVTSVDHEALFSQILARQATHYPRFLFLFDLLVRAASVPITSAAGQALINNLIAEIQGLPVDAVSKQKAAMVREFVKQITVARNETSQMVLGQTTGAPSHMQHQYPIQIQTGVGANSVLGGQTTGLTVPLASPAYTTDTKVRSDHWMPRIAIHDSIEYLYINVELPGVPKENVTVDVESTGKCVVLQGIVPTSQEREKILMFNECPIGSFSRQIQLPCAVDGQKTTAKCIDGVFEIKMKKLNPAKITVD